MDILNIAHQNTPLQAKKIIFWGGARPPPHAPGPTKPLGSALPFPRIPARFVPMAHSTTLKDATENSFQ